MIFSTSVFDFLGLPRLDSILFDKFYAVEYCGNPKFYTVEFTNTNMEVTDETIGIVYGSKPGRENCAR